MSLSKFREKLHDAQQLRDTDRALLLLPRLPLMPLPIQPYDDPFLPFGKAIINATRDLVCAYVFDVAAYLALGAAGAVALERTIAYAGVDDTSVTILHGPFVGAGYVEAAGTHAFNVDAVTLADDRGAASYREAGLGVFVVDDAAHASESLLVVDPTLRVRVLGAQVLYAGHGEDFADRVRAAIQSGRRWS